MNTEVTKKSGLTNDAIKRGALLIHDGMTDERFGGAVIERMPPTLPTDYEANLAALVKAVTDQSTARGTVNESTGTLAGKVADCAHHTRSARDIAKLALAGETALLHSEFAVGERSPQGIANIVTRAERIHAACVTHAEVLAESGWNAAATTALAAAIAALKDTDAAHFASKQAKKGATAELNRLADSMYVLCRKVQLVAQAVYPAADAANDSSIVEARGKFLLGTFPSKFRGNSAETAADPATPGGTPTAPGNTSTTPTPTTTT